MKVPHSPPLPRRAAPLGMSHLALLVSLLLHGAVAGVLFTVLVPAPRVGEGGSAWVAVRTVDAHLPLEEAVESDAVAQESLTESPRETRLSGAVIEVVEPPVTEHLEDLLCDARDETVAALEPIELPSLARLLRPARLEAVSEQPAPARSPAPVVGTPVPPTGPVATAPRSQGVAALRVKHAPNLLDFYPHEALRRGLEGTAVVEFRVNALGAVDVARLTASSGVRLLDDAALALVRAFRFEAPGEALWARRPVIFSVPGGAGAPARASVSR